MQVLQNLEIVATLIIQYIFQFGFYGHDCPWIIQGCACDLEYHFSFLVVSTQIKDCFLSEGIKFHANGWLEPNWNM